MLLSIIKSFNWIDIIILILILRIAYISASKGLFVEIFKFLGTIFATFICLHYYTRLGDIFEAIFKIRVINIEIWDFISFFILWLIVSGIFVLLRETFFMLVKIESVSIINKWISFLLGLGRSFIFVSLLMFLLSIPAVDYFKRSVRHSYLGSRLFFISPSLYKNIWDGFVSKFMPQKELNPAVSEIVKDLK